MTKLHLTKEVLNNHIHMEAIHSHLKMPLEVDQNSLTLIQVSANGGSAHSLEENNGFGK